MFKASNLLFKFGDTAGVHSVLMCSLQIHVEGKDRERLTHFLERNRKLSSSSKTEQNLFDTLISVTAAQYNCFAVICLRAS